MNPALLLKAAKALDKFKSEEGRAKANKRRRRMFVIAAAATALCSPVGLILGIVLLVLMIVGVGGTTSTAANDLAQPRCGVERVGVTTDAGPASPNAGAGLQGLSSGAIAYPMAAGSYTLASPWGMRDGGNHDGMDFAAPLGSPFYAAADGTVVKAEPADGYGHWIIIDHNVGGRKFQTLYGHMSADGVLVKAGDKVRVGQNIGKVGSEGFSSGPHLHFGVYEPEWTQGGGINPAPLLTQEGTAGPDPAIPAEDPSTTTGSSPPPADSNPAPEGTVTEQDWDKIADHESGGDWKINNGNGFFGGLQFSSGTWTGHGGDEYAATADKASKQEQMEVANKVLASQGWNAWPQTSFEAGVRDKKPAPEGTFVKAGGAAEQQPPANAPPPAALNDSNQNASAQDPACTETAGAPGSNNLKPGTVPAQWEADVQKAGTVCPEIPASIVAAQIDQESSWNPQAVSPSGANGLSQFMPGTWGSHREGPGELGFGADGDGDGARDPFNPHDAIAAQAKYDCYIVEHIRPHYESGKVKGANLTELALAGYNAGEGAVVEWGGIPPFPETQDYVPLILGKAKKYEGALSNPAANAPPQNDGKRILIRGAPFTQKMVEVASLQQGLPYVWGGGDDNGPTKGISGSAEDGFDCSGLVKYAVFQASGGKVSLPHYTGDQAADPRGKRISPNDLQPGDVVYSNSMGHVAIWLGDGKVLEAQDFGIPVGVHNANPSTFEEIRRFG